MADSKKPRGFAAFSSEEHRVISSRGGRIAHAKNTAHEWNSEEARIAGQKGGKSASDKRQKQKKQLSLLPDE